MVFNEVFTSNFMPLKRINIFKKIGGCVFYLYLFCFMKHIYAIKFSLYFVSMLTFLIKYIEYIYVYIFHKPIFIHLYFRLRKLSKQQKEILINKFGFYNRLSEEHKVYFEHRLSTFIRRKKFIGRDGFIVTNEVKILVGGVYVMLTFGLRKYLIDVFDKIIIYPSAYYSVINNHWHKGEFNYRFKAIVFSWEDFVEGMQIEHDNFHLGIHEFMHALSFYGKKSNDYSAKVFFEMHEDITSILHNPENILDIKKANYFRAYAYTNKLEFMAVVMEYFFESPDELKAHFPVLYQKIVKMLNYKF
ncbi:zinc-dependent peptidase [Tenacibaculum maritimum]|nr:zinc-dependent peptidase [Tenacibaculum maritimum]QCD61284.1 hypothetical protein B9C57_01420 [Tenacibaculum maritimum]CAA0196533.1 conserved membrane hypothetical protein [Tenacibaculum maritimum]CAA0242537.1 conserved membrane hypothetical protein [Tenacibaculum maritimum]